MQAEYYLKKQDVSYRTEIPKETNDCREGTYADTWNAFNSVPIPFYLVGLTLFTLGVICSMGRSDNHRRTLRRFV